MTTPDDVLVDAATAAANAQIPLFEPQAPVETSAQVSAPEPTPEAEKAAEGPADPAPPKEFDPRWRQPFQGLLYLGYLVEEFELWGHRFKIQTPSHLEKIQMGLVHAPYANTISTELVFETAMVAAYLTEIDGTELPRPIVNDPKETALHERFRWISENLKRPVISQVYNRCLALDEQVEKTLDAMGEA